MQPTSPSSWGPLCSACVRYVTDPVLCLSFRFNRNQDAGINCAKEALGISVLKSAIIGAACNPNMCLL